MTNSVEKGSKPKEEKNGYLSYLYEKYVVALYEKMLQKRNIRIVTHRAIDNFKRLQMGDMTIHSYKEIPEIKDFFEQIKIVQFILNYIEYYTKNRIMTDAELQRILTKVFIGTPFNITLDLRNRHDRKVAHGNISFFGDIPLNVYHFGSGEDNLQVVAQLYKIGSPEEYGSDFELRDLLN